ncbi:hypothetical protein EZV62_006518 [Acer yangbiense]|uniref:Uncharacterized protein n=1 Tax=Acer yangbiense TaxID=1000413 RepID=A0A5C7I6S1_9ROSI|nr:hypothetical protein EZV62_006518 [Acer yangbiense]
MREILLPGSHHGDRSTDVGEGGGEDDWFRLEIEDEGLEMRRERVKMFGKLMEVHGDYSEDVGVKLERPADEVVADAAPIEDIGA